MSLAAQAYSKELQRQQNSKLGGPREILSCRNKDHPRRARGGKGIPQDVISEIRIPRWSMTRTEGSKHYS